VVGSGPAGFYVSKNILSHLPQARVDLFDKLPHPFGLLRNGIAPDHQEMKNVQNDYMKVKKQQGVRFQFFGNVEVGRDVSVDQLKQLYSGVVLAYGAEGDRKMPVRGEGKNVYSAREVVSWYNGRVDWEGDIDWSGVRDLTLFGNGNVAIDIARILITPPE